MKLENGRIINQYKIISAIGKGGMGEVFIRWRILFEPLRDEPKLQGFAETDGFAGMNLQEGE